MRAITTFLGAVLSTIAVGVLLIAYGLLAPRLSATDASGVGLPATAAQRITGAAGDDSVSVLPRPVAYTADGAPLYDARALNDARVQSEARAVNAARPIPVVETYSAPSRFATVARSTTYQDRPVRVTRAPSRDWLKTAMVIGGSTAAGAGLGGIFGGKKGALIGAALGGGASTIYEVQKR